MIVVKGLDLKRYKDRWYEIASIPSSFEPSDCVNTRATYTLNNNATVHVLNETWRDGKKSDIEGTLYKADPNSDEAKFKVKFDDPHHSVTVNYWVLYVDHDYYQYALVGEPNRMYLWILSRKTHMDDETYNELVQKAKDEGYDVNKIHKTPQSEPPPEEEGQSEPPPEEKGPEDTKGI